MKESKRWLYLITGTVITLFLGLIYAWSIFREPFAGIYSEWTVSQIAFTFTISMIFFCLGGFIGGTVSKKLSPKVILVIAGLLLFIGFFGVSTLNPENSALSLKLLYLFYGVFGGTGVGIGYNCIISTVSKWYPDRVGLANGVLLMGFGLGGLALGSVVNSFIASDGLLPTFKILAFATAIVMFVGAAIIKIPKSVEKKEAKTAVTSSSKDYTTVEMMKTSRFWVFEIWTIMLSASGLLVISSAANISVAFGGSVVLGMIVSLFNGGGRILAGNNFDKFGRKKATLFNQSFMLVAGILLAVGAAMNSLMLIIIGLILVGMGYGGTPTIASTYINREFGVKHFAINFSVANFSLIPAAVIGPMLSAKLLEASGGSYDTNFYAICTLSVVAFILWIVLNKESEKVK